MTQFCFVAFQVILALKGAEDIQEQRQLAQQLHRMSAALRATLEQHVQVRFLLDNTHSCCKQLPCGFVPLLLELPKDRSDVKHTVSIPPPAA